MNNKTAGSRSSHLLLALILAPAFASPSAFGAQAPAEAPPAMVAKAEAHVEAYDSCQNGTLDLLGLREGTAAQAAKFRALAGVETQNFLVLHQACLGAVPELKGSCDQLGGIQYGRRNCRDDVAYAGIVAGIVGQGDARAACEQFQPSPYAKAPKKGDEEKRARKCDFLIAALRRGSSDVCGEAKAAGIIKGEALTQCRERLIFFNGVPDQCAAAEKTTESVCREKAALLFGMRSKDSRACALSPWCRAVSTRKPEACDPYLVRANKLFCDEMAVLAVPMKKDKAARDEKIREIAAKQKKQFKKGAPMQIVDPAKALKTTDGKKTP